MVEREAVRLCRVSGVFSWRVRGDKLEEVVQCTAEDSQVAQTSSTGITAQALQIMPVCYVMLSTFSAFRLQLALVSHIFVERYGLNSSDNPFTEVRLYKKLLECH